MHDTKIKQVAHYRQQVWLFPYNRIISSIDTPKKEKITDLKCYNGRCYHIEPIPGEEDQYICYEAYCLDLFEECSVTNMFTSIVGNVFGFKALRALRLEDLRILTTYIKTFQGSPHGIQVE
ncbi:hypothetical protein Godav_025123 [Gossypium davidsonii]|uniref:Ribulose bisphosphate carboxylase large chain n=4 Tax=Gossypium TaxID=3633 RepID=A0A7J8TH18_GOSDV|nr:hypothetical protein [Gossypium davidsonii]